MEPSSCFAIQCHLRETLFYSLLIISAFVFFAALCVVYCLLHLILQGSAEEQPLWLKLISLYKYLKKNPKLICLGSSCLVIWPPFPNSH